MADFKPYREKPLPLQDQAFCQASGRISRPFGSVLSSRIPGSPGDLQVKAAGIGVQIEHLSGKVQPRHELGTHGARVDLLERHAAGGNDGLVNGPRAGDRHRKMLEQLHELMPLLARDGVDLRILRDAGQTHEHRDHIAGLRVLIRRYGFAVCGTVGTLEALVQADAVPPDAVLMPISGRASVASLVVSPFATSHDCRESCGYVIELPDERRVAVATDTGVVTGEMKAALPGCDYVFIESNHDPDLLWHGAYPYALKTRIASPSGHLSNGDCAALLPELVRRGATRLVLAHLSAENNTPRLALDTAVAALAKAGMSAGVEYLLEAAAPQSEEDVTIF